MISVNGALCAVYASHPLDFSATSTHGAGSASHIVSDGTHGAVSATVLTTLNDAADVAGTLSACRRVDDLSLIHISEPTRR